MKYNVLIRKCLYDLLTRPDIWTAQLGAFDPNLILFSHRINRASL